MNEYDSNRILDLTKKIKYEPTKDLNEAHCYILNTCHIREKATDKVYHDIGRLKKKFRIRMLVRGSKSLKLQNSIAKIIPNYKFSSGIKLSVDVDPINFN